VPAISLGDHLVVPGTLVDELLESLLGILGVEVRREVDASREGFDALALAVVEQALEIDAAPDGLFLMGKAVTKDVGIILESIEDFRRQLRCESLAHNDHTNNAA
jgi:hypothetical protein